MIKEEAFSMACKEVFTILKFIDEQDIKNIPNDFIKLIEDNMDKEYEFEYNTNLEFEKQKLMRETLVILGYIFLNYWATDKQKEIINNKLKADLIEDDTKKQEIYNVNKIFDKKVYIKSKHTNALTIPQTPFYKKIINFIEDILKK